MLQGLRCDEVQVPGGGVVLAVMQAGGVDEVGVLTAQSRSLFIHGAHEGVHAAADLLRQNVARLVGGDDQHTLQQLLHRQHLPGPDAGGAAIRRQPLQGALRNSDWLVHGQLPAVHCLQRQQSGHDLGETGGIELLDARSFHRPCGRCWRPPAGQPWPGWRGQAPLRRRQDLSAGRPPGSAAKKQRKSGVFSYQTPTICGIINLHRAAAAAKSAAVRHFNS